MNSKNLIPLEGVYSWEKWTKPNPSIGTENRPADISSVRIETILIIIESL